MKFESARSSIKILALSFAIVVVTLAAAPRARAQASGSEPMTANSRTAVPGRVATTDVASPTVSSVPAATSSTVPSPAPPVAVHRGLLVETLDGAIVAGEGLDQAFNPASAVKLGTAYAALRTFGFEHRFSTGIWTNGTFDAATGTITGDLIISGRDPSFHYEHAIMVARELNKRGIYQVTGDLIVAPGFSMNFDWSSQRSGDQFYDTLDAGRRPAAATRAWYEERSAAKDFESLKSTPTVAVMGAVYVDSVPAGARTLLVHRSSRLIDILKVALCYSNNFMAERIGDNLGGAEGVQNFLTKELGLAPDEIKLASTSGLGVNRLTPRAMMKVMRALFNQLAEHRLAPSDILPVAGIDPGTLEKRYTDAQSRGSVIAKTGTLIRTDGGASALVGQLRTKNNETLLFVIFNQRGNVSRFRESQDALITQIQNSRGGPAPFRYQAQDLSLRLAGTQLNLHPDRKDEFEPK